jgi:hypothetical protein
LTSDRACFISLQDHYIVNRMVRPQKKSMIVFIWPSVHWTGFRNVSLSSYESRWKGKNIFQLWSYI